MPRDNKLHQTLVESRKLLAQSATRRLCRWSKYHLGCSHLRIYVPPLERISNHWLMSYLESLSAPEYLKFPFIYELQAIQCISTVFSCVWLKNKSSPGQACGPYTKLAFILCPVQTIEAYMPLIKTSLKPKQNLFSIHLLDMCIHGGVSPSSCRVQMCKPPSSLILLLSWPLQWN